LIASDGGTHRLLSVGEVVEEPVEDGMDGAGEDAAQGGAGEGEALA
jgi:hypothetical protein